MKVILSAEAERDLETISDRIAADNPDRARSFTRELVQAARGLATMPRRFPVLEAWPESGIRRRAHGNYLIFYRVEPTHIDVVRILHGARDYEAVLFPHD